MIYAAPIIIIATLLIGHNAQAETVLFSPPTFSVFFSSEELQEIDEKAEAARRDNPLLNSDRINLGAIIYIGEDSWKIWLQGRMRTPDTIGTSPRIISVSPHQVKIAVKQNDGAETEITLFPHQTYRISTGEIVEGN